MYSSLYCFITVWLLEHAICLVVLFFCHFIVLLLFLNKINGDGEISASDNMRRVLYWLIFLIELFSVTVVISPCSFSCSVVQLHHIMHCLVLSVAIFAATGGGGGNQQLKNLGYASAYTRRCTISVVDSQPVSSSCGCPLTAPVYLPDIPYVRYTDVVTMCV